MLDDGTRCSNQAVPGSRYCQTHGRITFRPIKEPADTAPAPPPVKPAPPPPDGTVVTPSWQAVASPAGGKPRFTGLSADARNILVAPQGLIWLAADPDRGAQHDRLVRLIGFLSQSFSLPGQVELQYNGDSGDVLIRLSPVTDDLPKLSSFYDTASAAARLVDGRLYIGKGYAFVQYRDDSAPRGYDVPDYKAWRRRKELLLVAHWGSQVLSVADFAELSLAELCLRVGPLPEPAGPLPEQVWVLAPAALYPILARYFRAHYLRYRLARLDTGHGELILFEITPLPTAPSGPAVPAFILDYLSRLPRVVVLEEAHRHGEQLILVQWRHRFPFHLPHTSPAFAADDLVLLNAGHYPNLVVNPCPQLLDGDLLTKAQSQRPAARRIEPLAADDTDALKLEVVLRPDSGPTPPIAALVLSAQELSWLRQLLYRLPGEAFAAYSLCQGDEGGVLVGTNRGIEGIPFGRPLRRIAESELFIPLRSRFVPDLPWPVLQQALEIKSDTYTFFTEETRLDLPVAAFSPLSKALVADPGRPRVKLELRTGPGLPDLRWTSPPPPQEPEQEPDQPRSRPAPARSQARPTEPEPGFDPELFWRDQARTYEAARDYLAAAVCYSLVDDQSSSARCYRQAAIASPAQHRE
jgi:hypothetical protein